MTKTDARARMDEISRQLVLRTHSRHTSVNSMIMESLRAERAALHSFLIYDRPVDVTGYQEDQAFYETLPS